MIESCPWKSPRLTIINSSVLCNKTPFHTHVLWTLDIYNQFVLRPTLQRAFVL